MNPTRTWPSPPVTLTKIKTPIRSKVGWDVGKLATLTLFKVSRRPGRQFRGIVASECRFTPHLTSIDMLFSASSLGKKHRHSQGSPAGCTVLRANKQASKQATSNGRNLTTHPPGTQMNGLWSPLFGRILDSVLKVASVRIHVERFPRHAIDTAKAKQRKNPMFHLVQ